MLINFLKKYRIYVIVAFIFILASAVALIFIVNIRQFINTPPYSFSVSQISPDYLIGVEKLANLNKSELFVGPEIDSIRIFGDLESNQYILVTVFEDQEIDITDFNPLSETGENSDQISLEEECNSYYENYGSTRTAQFYEAGCDGDYYYMYINKDIKEGENIITFSSIGLDKGIFEQALIEYTE